VRESVRKALEHKMRFTEDKEMLESAKKIGKIKYNFDISPILEKSIFLKKKKEQKTLREWF